ncbi:MAG: dynamin family protein, partial [Armatimonadetes bacterium]|nr:dynamin family protein [Armatimonadota bacterium]
MADRLPRRRSEADARTTLRRCTKQARRLAEQLAALECPDLAERLAQHAERLADRAFHLVIAGEFSLGKSTLANALLGTDVLPMAVVPCTAMVTRVGYGPQLEARVSVGGLLRPLAAARDLLEFVADRVQESVQQTDWAEVFLPAEICQQETILYDTPGLNEAQAPDAATAKAVADADLVLFVVDLRRAGSLSERADLAAWFGETPGNVLLVANFANLVDANDRPPLAARLVAFAAAYANPYLPRPWFAVDALGGLRARLDGNQKAWRASGMADLEAALLHATRRNRWPLAARARLGGLAPTLSGLEGATAWRRADAVRAAEAARREREALAAARDQALLLVEQARERWRRGFDEVADRYLAETRALARRDPEWRGHLSGWFQQRLESYLHGVQRALSRTFARAQRELPLPDPWVVTLQTDWPLTLPERKPPSGRAEALARTARTAARQGGAVARRVGSDLRHGMEDLLERIEDRLAHDRARKVVGRLQEALSRWPVEAFPAADPLPGEDPGEMEERERAESALRQILQSVRRHVELQMGAFERALRHHAARAAGQIST